MRAGLVDPARAGEAEAVVRATAQASAPGGAVPLRRRMAEVAGYVGGAFVVGAALLFFAGTWNDLGLGQQVGLLLGTGLLLAVSGLAFARAGGEAAPGGASEAVRRRLASVLLTGAAASTAFGLGLLLTDRLAEEETAVLLAALAGLAVCLAGYAFAPTSVGQLGAAGAAVVAVPSGLAVADVSGDGGPVATGLLVLALGVGWWAAAERGWWRETMPARLVGSGLAVVGAQIPVFTDQAWVGYVSTAGVGAAAFGLYVALRAWPYLATGVVAVTIAVPEALDDWVGGSLGAAGILLATGVTLLATALLGLRLRHEVHEGSAAGASARAR